MRLRGLSEAFDKLRESVVYYALDFLRLGSETDVNLLAVLRPRTLAPNGENRDSVDGQDAFFFALRSVLCGFVIKHFLVVDEGVDVYAVGFKDVVGNNRDEVGAGSVRHDHSLTFARQVVAADVNAHPIAAAVVDKRAFHGIGAVKLHAIGVKHNALDVVH